MVSLIAGGNVLDGDSASTSGTLLMNGGGPPSQCQLLLLTVKAVGEALVYH